MIQHPPHSAQQPSVLKPFFGLAFLSLCGGIVYEIFPDILRLWGRHAGLSLTSLDFLTFLNVGGNFIQILLAPFFSFFPPFFFRKYGLYRAWILFLLTLTIIGLLILPTIPFFSTAFLCVAALCMISSKSYDSLTTTFQMRVAPSSHWGIGDSIYVNGYRLGIICSANVALWAMEKGASLSSILWTVAGVIILFCFFFSQHSFFHFLKNQDQETMLHPENKPPRMCTFAFFTDPFTSLMEKPQWGWILFVLIVYRLSDGMMNPVRSFFYMDYGFSLIDLGVWIKTPGMIALAIGGVVGGVCIRKYGYFPPLLWGLVLHGLSYGMMWFGTQGIWEYSGSLWIVCNGVEELAKGFSTVALLSSQLLWCRHHMHHAVTHSAIFGAISWGSMGAVGCWSGRIVDQLGWSWLYGFMGVCTLAAFYAVLMVRASLRGQYSVIGRGA